MTNIIFYELYPLRSFGVQTFSYEHLAYDEHYPCDLLSGHLHHHGYYGTILILAMLDISTKLFGLGGGHVPLVPCGRANECEILITLVPAVRKTRL